ncbi:hypothetical protein Tco_0882458 [Tanacetum coccineum]
MILAPGQPIPYGRPYHYHPNGPVHMITMRKRVGLIHVQQLAVRHSVNHSSSDYFSPDDSARDSSSDSSLEATSDFHLDASSDSSSRHSLLDHSSPDLPSSFAGPSCKRRRSLMTSVPTLQPVSGALFLICADLIPSPKRVRDSGYLVDVRVDPRRTSLRDDVIIKGSDEPHLEQDIDLEIQVEIDECFAYADALRDRGLMLEFHDHIEAIPVHRIQVIEGVQEKRLRGTMSVKNQRVDRIQRGMSRMQRELRQIRRLRFYDRIEAREVTMNLEPLNENRDEQDSGNGGNGGNGNGGNGGNGNGGNGGNENGGNGENKNGNRNRIHGMNY